MLICDCHVHVIGPKSRYPLVRQRTYTPRDAPFEALEVMMARLELSRVVLVQPSVHGTDNRCLIDALTRLGDRGRGVAIVADDVSPTELDDLHRHGVRGLRLNIATFGTAPIDEVRRRLNHISRLCARNGWHLQVFLPPVLVEALAPSFRDLPVPIVVDHFGLISPRDIGGKAAQLLRAGLAEGRLWVKLSAPYRISENPADPAIATLARSFADANPERVVWGSDWPHTPPHTGATTAGDEEMPYRDLDTRALLGLVDEWLPNKRMRQRLLVENPARLYGFD